MSFKNLNTKINPIEFSLDYFILNYLINYEFYSKLKKKYLN